ncbi:hypothetical protein SAMN06264364_108126 [Quadrisphaera granulorum]|uniref:CHAP domain-containing protein n=1 Tax=Quadrisphaera granulorum TaxID=317664 RepID=A0A316A9Y9_9ACTN|nr:hypothetical protein [Quadrisphaera granulorum]PWJ54219.1 hypothetical protein BXY45_108126 [Quadrisphaera granulorum]SZE96358.1 hypothetical protein SAMN06264364_108126 [Quadrisphaera granulorum]
MKTSRRLRVRLSRTAAVAVLAALPLGVGSVALAGAASAAEPTFVQDSQGRTTDALGGKHRVVNKPDGQADGRSAMAWFVAGQRFTESHHDGCNPYSKTSMETLATTTECPSGQKQKFDWNTDFVVSALASSGLNTTGLSSDLTTFTGLGSGAPYYHHEDTPQYDVVPNPGDLVLWTDPSGKSGAVGVVIDATSASHVKVVIGDINDKIATKWINPATSKVRGNPVTYIVTPADARQ